MRALPHIEKHQRPRLPGILHLADHQLVELGGAGPVDPAEVVAAAVAAEGEEVLAASLALLRPARHLRRIAAPDVGIAGQRLGGRVDDELVNITSFGFRTLPGPADRRP